MGNWTQLVYAFMNMFACRERERERQRDRETERDRDREREREMRTHTCAHQPQIHKEMEVSGRLM